MPCVALPRKAHRNAQDHIVRLKMVHMWTGLRRTQPFRVPIEETRRGEAWRGEERRGEERRFAGSLVVSSARRVSRARRAATIMDENHVANVGEALRMRAEAVATLEKYVHPISIPSPPPRKQCGGEAPGANVSERICGRPRLCRQMIPSCLSFLLIPCRPLHAFIASRSRALAGAGRRLSSCSKGIMTP